MKKITIEVSVSDYKALERILKKLNEAMNPVTTKSKKWINKGEYMLNTVTGARIDKVTKRRYWNVHGKDEDEMR